MFSQPLPITRYRFTASVQQPLALPDYAGSLLRGQFGAALRSVACMTRALKQGLTRARVPVELLQVARIDEHGSAQPIWHIEQPTLLPHPTTLDLNAIQTVAQSHDATLATGQNVTQITLHIHTPMRLQHQGQPLGVGQLTLRVLLSALARRSALLMQFHAGQSGWGQAAKHISALSADVTDQQDLHWFDWTRYSSRQQQEMTLGGVLGRWQLHGSADTLAQLWPWLWLGQWLHVGKNASMGLGGYTLRSDVGLKPDLPAK